MVSARQRSADFFVRYAIVDADRQGVTGPLDCSNYKISMTFDQYILFKKNILQW